MEWKVGVADPCRNGNSTDTDQNFLNSSSTRQYLVLLVELGTQSGKPTKEEGLRVIGNLTRRTACSRPRARSSVGIGTRVCMEFTDVAPWLTPPQWTIDESAADGTRWRYRVGGAQPISRTPKPY